MVMNMNLEHLETFLPSKLDHRLEDQERKYVPLLKYSKNWKLCWILIKFFLILEEKYVKEYVWKKSMLR